MNKFGIILGEPNSINIEILAKSNALKKRCIVIGNFDLLNAQLKILKFKTKLNKINSTDEIKSLTNCLNVLDIPLKFKNPFKVKPNKTKDYLKKCFNKAHRLSVDRKLIGFINCPINKKNFFGDKNYGITEYLAKKNNCFKSEVMMIYNRNLAVVPITTHIRVKDIVKNLNKKDLVKKLKTLNNEFYEYFKTKPNIGVIGLNPHNFELKNKSEEKTIIIPAILSLKKKAKIYGPFSADTIFLKENFKKFNVLVGMYHDQVLSPFKSLFGLDAINITLGLPYHRVSPDHGTAEDKVKLRTSKPTSLNMCINFMSKLKHKC